MANGYYTKSVRVYRMGEGAPYTGLKPSGLSNSVMAIATGDNHNCAVMFSGGAKCWGSNNWGELVTWGLNSATYDLPVSATYARVSHRPDQYRRRDEPWAVATLTSSC